MTEGESSSIHERWAHLRFSVVGHLLAAPPSKGALRQELEKLAAREWRHPSSGLPVRFGVSTIERWYYKAVKERRDPVQVLRRKLRSDHGAQDSMNLPLRQALRAQYAASPSWSIQLHHDNLVALALTRPELNPLPSYSTIRRLCKAQGSDEASPPVITAHRRCRARRGTAASTRSTQL